MSETESWLRTTPLWGTIESWTLSHSFLCFNIEHNGAKHDDKFRDNYISKTSHLHHHHSSCNQRTSSQGVKSNCRIDAESRNSWNVRINIKCIFSFHYSHVWTVPNVHTVISEKLIFFFFQLITQGGLLELIWIDNHKRKSVYPFSFIKIPACFWALRYYKSANDDD